MVVKIWKNFYVATVDDVDRMTEKQRNEFSIIGACKNPLHRRHAKPDTETEDGYYGKKMTKEDKEYYFCERGKNLFLNLVCGTTASQISDVVISKAMMYMDKEYKAGNEILIVDNNGCSQAPSLILLWFIHVGLMDGKDTAEEILTGFKKNLYRSYSPSQGMIEYIRNVWNERKDFYAKQKKGL